MATAERDLDLVVFGATGLTGRQVAAYLGPRADEVGMRWAPAARDRSRLERVMAEVGANPEEAIVADLADPRSLAEMAGRARVVLNLVGPYTAYGLPVIEACVEAGTDYVDLSGEIPFVRSVIDRFHERAVERGMKLIQVCGFEALPPDLAVLLAAETARERFDDRLAEVDVELSARWPTAVPRPSDFVSGGTLQSVAEAAAGEGAAAVTDPAALVTGPEAEAIRRRSPITVAPRRAPSGPVIAPMAPAAFINPAVIHRSAALLAAERGELLEPFRYREGLAISGGPASLPLRYALAGALAGTQAAMGGIARAAPGVRRRFAGALRRALPSSGFGPAADRMEGWTWAMKVAARTERGSVVRVEIEADGHPGYLSTARMLGEAGLILAAPDLTPDRGGCLTPALALGTGALERFEHAQVRFRVP